MSPKEHASYNIKTVQGEGGGVYLNCIQQSLMVEGHAAVLFIVCSKIPNCGHRSRFEAG